MKCHKKDEHTGKSSGERSSCRLKPLRGAWTDATRTVHQDEEPTEREDPGDRDTATAKASPHILKKGKGTYGYPDHQYSQEKRMPQTSSSLPFSVTGAQTT